MYLAQLTVFSLKLNLLRVPIPDTPLLLHLHIPPGSLDDLSSSCFQFSYLDISRTPKSMFPVQTFSLKNPLAVYKSLCRAPKTPVQNTPKLISLSSFLFLKSLSAFPTLVNVTVIPPAVQASSKWAVHLGHSGPTLLVTILDIAAPWAPLLPLLRRPFILTRPPATVSK